MLHHCAFAWKTMKERPFAWRVVYPKRYHHSSSSFLTIFPQKCQAKNHDGSGQKFLSTSDSIWPQLMQALVIIMVCKLGGTSSISAEKFVNPWKISIMSEPIIPRDAGLKIFLAFFLLYKNLKDQSAQIDLLGWQIMASWVFLFRLPWSLVSVMGFLLRCAKVSNISGQNQHIFRKISYVEKIISLKKRHYFR